MSFKVKQFRSSGGTSMSSAVLEHRQRRGRRNIAWQAYTAKNFTEAISMAISNTGTDICILQPSVATC